MNAIAVNTLTGAVSEYEGFSFQSVTPTHAGDAAGLFELGGDTDNGQAIVAEIRLPVTLRENSLKQHIAMVYLSMRGAGEAEFAVFGSQGQSWNYPFPLRASEQTRCPVGKGIRENYLGFGLRNPQGQAFTLDRVEILSVKSKTRRV